MPRRRKPTTSSGSAGSQRRRSFQSDSSDDWEYEPTRGEVYRDRFYAILRFLWDTTKLTMAWLSFVWLAAHVFDEWSLRDARKYIDVAEQMATKSDLNGARDAYSVALGHLQRAEVREPFASSALAAGGRLFRLPVLFLLRNPWPAVEARLIALAATIRALASVPEPGEGPGSGGNNSQVIPAGALSHRWRPRGRSFIPCPPTAGGQSPDIARGAARGPTRPPGSRASRGSAHSVHASTSCRRL